MLLPAAWFVVETARPDCLDPTYVRTRTNLAAARANHPDHRLAVVIGSSRTQIGFDPNFLPSQSDASGRPVLWFNAGHYEAGPGMNHVTLSRLLRDGPAPAMVVMEILPAFCAHGAAGLLAKHATYRDASAVLAADIPEDFLFTAMKRRVTRVRDLASAWTGSDSPPLASGPSGNTPAPPAVPPEERARRTAAQLAWLNYLLELPSIHPATDRATAATVAACRERGIDLVFVLTPESPTFRAAYDPAGLVRFNALGRRNVPEPRRPSHRRPGLVAGRTVRGRPPPHRRRGRGVHRPTRPRTRTGAISHFPMQKRSAAAWHAHDA